MITDYFNKYRKWVRLVNEEEQILIVSTDEPKNLVYLQYYLFIYEIDIDTMFKDIEFIKNEIHIDIIELIQYYLLENDSIKLRKCLTEYNNSKILNKLEEKEFKIIKKKGKI